MFKADAEYVGSKIDIYALKERPEFSAHYKRIHKGAVVLALTPRHISEACEAQARGGQPRAARPEAGCCGDEAQARVQPRGRPAPAGLPTNSLQPLCFDPPTLTHRALPAAWQGMPLEPGYLVAFNYGSVVFFNAGGRGGWAGEPGRRLAARAASSAAHWAC